MQENWPSHRGAPSCGCVRCAGARSWRRGPRAVALAHAQNRLLGDAVEAALEGLGDINLRPEATVYGDHTVKWERRMPLTTFLALPDPRFRDPARQWNYRIYLNGDRKPLYVGKTGPREQHVKKGVRDRLMQHARGDGGKANPTIGSPADARRAAAAHLKAPRLGLAGDAKLMADISKSLGRGAFEVTVGEVFKRKLVGGKVQFTQPDRLGNLLTELFQRKNGVALINRPDREDDVETAVEELADEHDLPGSW
jgi:hypothetical protein